MKAVILAGGYGTRIMEESSVGPKPMVEIGGAPILWHILKIYSFHGINDFVICCGYKGNMIKDYFLSYYQQKSDFTIDLQCHHLTIHKRHTEPWRVTLVDTGEHTMTGGRVKRVQNYLDGETFCMTYGDGVSNVNIRECIAFHNENKNIATLTAVHPPGRFGAFILDSGSSVNVGRIMPKTAVQFSPLT